METPRKRICTATMALIIGILSLSSSVFVGPSQDDRKTVESEYTSISKAIKNLSPGDTLFLLPGTYRVSPDEISRKINPGPYAVVFDLSMSGEKGRPIVIRGVVDDEGRRPIIDFSDVVLHDEENPEGYRITGFLLSGDFLHVSDLECTGLRVTRTDHTQSENFRINGGSYNTLENISCHDGMGIGVYMQGDSHHNLILNCDAYNNYDPVSDISSRTGEGSGGNNDGFGCHVKGSMEGNAFIGCRAWRNSDDGFDLINCFSPVEISYCIAVENGFDAEGNNRADGNGIKGGGFGMRPRDIPLYNRESPRHMITNNVAVANKAHGIYANHHIGGIDFSQNTGLLNGKANYSMVNRKGAEKDGNMDVNGYGHSLRSNLSLSAGEKHYLWITKDPAEYEISLVESSVAIDYSILFTDRQTDGTFNYSVIKYIENLKRNSSGACFCRYSEAVIKAKKITGSDSE